MSTRAGALRVGARRSEINAQVIIKNLQNMHAKSLPPTGARARLELEYLTGLGPPARQGTTHGRTQRPPSGMADVVELRDGQWFSRGPSLADRF